MLYRCFDWKDVYFHFPSALWGRSPRALQWRPINNIIQPTNLNSSKVENNSMLLQFSGKIFRTPRHLSGVTVVPGLKSLLKLRHK